MILIADSGSTKTRWIVLHGGALVRMQETDGLNPFFQSEEDLTRHIAESVMPQLNVSAPAVRAVYFYGAGCVYDRVEVMRRALAYSVPDGAVEVYSDLLGAARGLCGREAGIACVLGTGSNSCFYDGRQIVSNVSPLGYILGDEGSGADLGKHLVGNLMKDMMPPMLKESFLDRYALTLPEIVDRVYRQPCPNRFLAGFSPFLLDNLHEPSVHALVLERFKAFFLRNVSKYDFRSYRAHFSGSIAFHFKGILREAAHRTGFRLGSVITSPAGGLITFHSQS
ncbi:MAG: ATPase [Tannerella sp.]|jgi:N-acetylglucosamine kinase-like BadF-type ATPase|nr:ATPase [Tannerella sp.]